MFLEVMVLSMILIQSVNGCPRFCSCYEESTVDCSHKLFLQIEVDRIPKTTKIIDYSNNQLSKVTRSHFQGLNLLEELYLHQNMIAEIEDGSFKDLTNLTSLFLNKNSVGFITGKAFQGLFKLTNLWIENLHQGSQQLKIADGAFSDLINLEMLFLDNNKIKHFTDDTFKGLNNLKILNFNFDLVSSISSKAFDMFPSSLLITNKGKKWLQNMLL